MSEWQTIDSAPRDGTGFVGGWFDQFGNFHYAITYWTDYGWRMSRTTSPCYATHWQPLPAPPEKQK